MTILGIDPSVAGIAGDMFVASLLDVIDQPENSLNEIMDFLNDQFPHLEVSLLDKNHHHIYGKYLKFVKSDTKLNSNELRSHINQLFEKSKINSQFRELGNLILETLISVEKEIHRTEHVHLHELGTVDTVFDIFATCYLLSELKINKIQISPVATGYGVVKTSHGMLPVPTPATQLILEKGQFTTLPGPKGEATTPTGISILYGLSQIFDSEIQVIWKKSGIGYGTRTFEDRGNLLRIRLGEKTSEATQISILETNIDDVSGEFLGDAVGKLMEIGALDVSYYSIIMKKNRPAYCLRILCKNEDIEKIADKVQRLTGTLGIRVQQITRHIGERSVKEKVIFVQEWNETVKVRIKYGSRGKIEFDDLIKLGEEKGMTPLEIYDILIKNYKEEKQ